MGISPSPASRGVPPKEYRKLINLLEAAEWKEVRPGRLEKSITYGEYGEFKGTKFVCTACRAEWPMTFMLKDEVWLKITSKRDVLCFLCAEKKLGRPIGEDDLKSVPGNRELIYIFQTRMSYHGI